MGKESRERRGEMGIRGWEMEKESRGREEKLGHKSVGNRKGIKREEGENWSIRGWELGKESRKKREVHVTGA